MLFALHSSSFCWAEESSEQVLEVVGFAWSGRKGQPERKLKHGNGGDPLDGIQNDQGSVAGFSAGADLMAPPGLPVNGGVAIR